MKNTKLYKIILVGHLMINVPAILLTFGLPFLSFFYFEHIGLKILFAGLGFVTGIVLSWKLWSLLVTKWRLWAFNQVEEENWHELKELAIANKLIWEDGSSYELLEKRSTKEKKQLSDIANKISEQEQIEEIKLDLNTPEELRITFNKREIIVESISKLLILFVSIGLLLVNQLLLGVILLAIVLFYGDSYKLIKHALSNEDYLVVNQKGILLKYPKLESIGWEEMETLAIHTELRKMIIVKIEPNQSRKIECELWRLNIKDTRKFEKQLKVFIDRYLYNQEGI